MSGFAVEGANLDFGDSSWSTDGLFSWQIDKSRAIVLIPLPYNTMVIMPSLLLFYDFCPLIF